MIIDDQPSNSGFHIVEKFYPAWEWLTVRELENGPVEIVSFPIFLAWWIFPLLCKRLPEANGNGKILKSNGDSQLSPINDGTYGFIESVAFLTMTMADSAPIPK